MIVHALHPLRIGAAVALFGLGLLSALMVHTTFALSKDERKKAGTAELLLGAISSFIVAGIVLASAL